MQKINTKTILMLLTAALFFPILAEESKDATSDHSHSEPKKETKANKEFYEDTETGQIFTKPGPGRTKVEYLKPMPREITTLPDGFAHRPDDVKKEKITVYGRMQFRGVSGSVESPYSNGHSDFNAVDWNFRRLRFGTMYENDWWGMNIQFRMENMVNRPNTATTTTNVVTGVSNNNGIITTTTTPVVNTVRMSDNRGYVHEALIYAKHPYAGLRLTFGQMNTQFTREYLQSSANFITLERSIITNAIPQFDLGVMVSALPLKELGHKWERYLQVSLMVGNGKGAGGDYGTGRRQDLTTANRWGTVLISPTYYARAQYNVFGGLKREADGKEVNWQEGEEVFQKEMKWSIGAGYMQTANFQPNTLAVPEYMPGTTNAFNLLNGQQSNPDRGSTTNVIVNNITMSVPNYNVQNSATTPGRPSFGLVGHTYDTTFTFQGAYITGAYTKYTGAASNNLHAWHTTIGYNIPIMDKYYIMPVLKYEEIAGDFHRDGNSHNQNDILRVYWAGVNLFGDKHHFKAQLFYQILGNKFDVNPNTGNYTAIDDRRIYLQLQGNFWTGTVSPEAYSYRPN
ncbi:MAG: hypothetical protein IPO06_23475 [Leptospiraceae bacterium]|nr:hypothetical protein [Leptospiraceae bacterium]